MALGCNIAVIVWHVIEWIIVIILIIVATTGGFAASSTVSSTTCTYTYRCSGYYSSSCRYVCTWRYTHTDSVISIVTRNTRFRYWLVVCTWLYIWVIADVCIYRILFVMWDILYSCYKAIIVHMQITCTITRSMRYSPPPPVQIDQFEYSTKLMAHSMHLLTVLAIYSQSLQQKQN